MLCLSLANKRLKTLAQCGGSMRLTRKQIEQLADIVDHFQEVEIYDLYEEHTGIGPIVKVKFSLFGKTSDTSVDITDVESW
jgi:hypothetical protein